MILDLKGKLGELEFFEVVVVVMIVIEVVIISN